MERLSEIKPVYVDTIPEELEHGVLYISDVNHTSTHLCACGCGVETVLPLIGPKSWTYLDVNGMITIRPSVGNWSGEKPYHAHYYITNNMIQWR